MRERSTIRVIETTSAINDSVNLYSNNLSLKCKIYKEIELIIREFQPQQMAIEDVFLSNNPSSAIKLGQARGAAICATVMQGVPVFEYSAREIKQAVVGKGNADKSQVQHMVKLLLNLQGKIQSDTADGLAIALSHAHVGATKSRLQEALLKNG